MHLFLFLFEVKLKEELFRVHVPLCPKLVIPFLYLTAGNLRNSTYITSANCDQPLSLHRTPLVSTGSASVTYLAKVYLKADSFIWFGCKEQVLPLAIGWLHPLFISRHEPVSRQYAIHYLWVVNLEKQAVLVCVRIPLLSNCR